MKALVSAIYTITLFLFCSFNLYASKVDTVETTSQTMNKTIKAVVITPTSYSKDKKYPVIYLLHGASSKGSYRDWIKNAPNIAALADKYDLIIVCPDGNPTSWYMDAPADTGSKYETYVSSELVKYMDGHYATINDKGGRGITGLSMGGFGSLYLGIRHQDIFGAAGSMSGGVDFRTFPKRWGLEALLGSYEQFPDRWNQVTISNMIKSITPGYPLMIDCGFDDFFYPANQELHSKLLGAKIDHDYIIRPGGHTWKYWGNSVEYQALFMSRFFRK